jgi:hypothetical protein
MSRDLRPVYAALFEAAGKERFEEFASKATTPKSGVSSAAHQCQLGRLPLREASRCGT